MTMATKKKSTIKKPTRGEPPRKGADANDPGEGGKKLPGTGTRKS
jgi:hypothetical protein